MGIRIVPSATLVLAGSLICACGATLIDPVDAKASSSATATQTPSQISVKISPTSAVRRGLATLPFTSSVASSTNQAVTWSVNGMVGGNSTVGTITPAGLYTAPGNPPAATVTVTATSVADATRSASSVITLQNAIPTILFASSPLVAGTNITLYIQGTGFAPAATVLLGTTPLSVQWISSTRLVATGYVVMPAGGTASLAVSNPAPGPARSNLYTVAVAQPSGQPMLSVDAATNLHAISDDIYGIAYGPGLTPPDINFAKQIALPGIRWGGDASTNYNWLWDTTNAGSDNFFVNFIPGKGKFVGPGYSADQMISTYQAVSPSIHPVITIPIIPWVANNNATLCTYPVLLYGTEQRTTTWAGNRCGNGLTSSGANVPDTSVYLNYESNSVAIQAAWIEHLISTFGTAAEGGVTYYQLDNEPSAWRGVHHDIEPTQSDYTGITALGEQYASMIKSVDPSAKVLGPSDFTEYGWTYYPPAGSSLYSGQYYLQQMAAFAASHGNVRVLDDFDEHWSCPDLSSAAAELNSPRTLWDPAYNASTPFEVYLKGPIAMIPRFKDWIAAYYPGTGISISEYECVAKPGSPTLVDALAEADILGIFGQQGVALANNFNSPRPGDPLAMTYLMYRNYDAAGSRFGDTSVSATSTVPAKLAIYGAVRKADGKLTVVVINKTTSAIPTTLALENFNAVSAPAASYSYSALNLTSIMAGSSAIVSSNTLGYTFPAYSITLLVFDPAE